MEGDFLMTKRQPLMDYDHDGVSLKNSKHLLGISYRTCIRWKQCHCIKQLVIPHGLKGKIGNKTSSIKKAICKNHVLKIMVGLVRAMLVRIIEAVAVMSAFM